MMNRALILLGVFIICTAIFHKTLSKKVDYKIIPGVKVGLIKANTSESDLHRMLGIHSILPWDINVGEGETVPGTVLKINDQPCTIGIIWKDSVNKKSPLEVRFFGSGTKWETDEGITLGKTLKELEQINGKPFMLTGFEWDYSGTFMSSNSGKLSFLDRISTGGKKPADKMLIRLQPSPAQVESTSQETYLSVAGDHLYRSDNAAMQKLNPVVNEMIVYFPSED